MYKPKKTIKFKSYSKSLVPKKIIYDNITLKIMEFKMRSTYNSNEGSVYTLNDKEKEVFKYHIRQMMNAGHYNDCTERIMISIIHNIEKDRYYVGQSKDIMRRIKQHFKGTMPNNIIFAEDYYNSQNSDKSNIFEIRIIQLETKDELDKTEAQLIEEYDANVTGYNSTRGNN